MPAESFSPVLFWVSLFCAVLGVVAPCLSGCHAIRKKCHASDPLVSANTVQHDVFIVFVFLLLLGSLLYFFRCSYDGMQASSGRRAAENRSLGVPQWGERRFLDLDAAFVWMMNHSERAGKATIDSGRLESLKTAVNYVKCLVCQCVYSGNCQQRYCSSEGCNSRSPKCWLGRHGHLAWR